MAAVVVESDGDSSGAVETAVMKDPRPKAGGVGLIGNCAKPTRTPPPRYGSLGFAGFFQGRSGVYYWVIRTIGSSGN